MERGQFSVATEDQSDNGVALDTNLDDGLDTDTVSNFNLVSQLMVSSAARRSLSRQGHGMADHGEFGRSPFESGVNDSRGKSSRWNLHFWADVVKSSRAEIPKLQC
ncbi:hypothetical protein B0H14DRAFT_2569614 [Mycena olivaceomarginata]|nr:hypothetical protein B0H14DRAFT_2569614 [Mycena olivaceomarginata]